MTEQVTTPMNSSSAEIAAGDRPSVLRVLRVGAIPVARLRDVVPDITD